MEPLLAPMPMGRGHGFAGRLQGKQLVRAQARAPGDFGRERVLVALAGGDELYLFRGVGAAPAFGLAQCAFAFETSLAGDELEGVAVGIELLLADALGGAVGEILLRELGRE